MHKLFPPPDYETAREANDRLSNTVIFLGDSPIFVVEVAGASKEALKIHYSTFDDIRQGVVGGKSVPLNDPAVNVYNMRLGYLNSARAKTAIYLTRRPVRRMNQGLCVDAITGYINYLSANQLLSDPGFEDCLVGKYPSFSEAVERLEQDPTLVSVAFARNMAIERDLKGLPHKLMHRGNKIGLLNKGREPQIPECFDYLTETLKEVGIR